MQEMQLIIVSLHKYEIKNIKIEAQLHKNRENIQINC